MHPIVAHLTLPALAAVLVLGPAAAAPPGGDTLMRRSGPTVARDASGRLVVEDHPGLRDPSRANETAPDIFRARFVTTRGPVVIEVQRAWSPRGADRFWNLIRVGYFNDIAFFRVIPGFMAQFGIHGDPEVAASWRGANLQDDLVKQSNQRGYLSFAMAGPNTRTTQIFINFGNNARLDGMGFSPFGRIVSGMEAIERLYGGYGEGAPSGKGPDQHRVQTHGNAYLRESFGELDYILEAEIIAEPSEQNNVEQQPMKAVPKTPDSNRDDMLEGAPGARIADAAALAKWLDEHTATGHRVQVPLKRLEKDLGSGKWAIVADAAGLIATPIRVSDLTSAGIAHAAELLVADGRLVRDPETQARSFEIVRIKRLDPASPFEFRAVAPTR